MIRRCAIYCLAVCLAVSVLAEAMWAHEVRPAYLELKQVGSEAYDLLFRVPARGDQRLALHLHLPSDCINVAPPVAAIVGGAYVERSRISRPGGLPGATISVEGLAASMTDVLVRIERSDGSTQVARLSPEKVSFVVEAAPRLIEITRTYFALGVEHILTGADHLLFVTGLLLLVQGLGRLVRTITAFTVSHTVTLSLATLGFVHIPQAPVEAVIALSILFVACEVLKRGRGAPGITQRQPWLIAFTFGLLHGLGFAGGLSEAGLPTAHIPLALALFSTGVEAGHFLFVGTILSLIALVSWRRLAKPSAPAWARALPAYAIGSIAGFWLIERTVRLF